MKRNGLKSFRWQSSNPPSPSSTNPTQDWTSTPSASSPKASTSYVAPDNALILITHYQRILNYLDPDAVHVLMDGRLVRSGGSELALEVESKGYDRIDEWASAPQGGA